MAFGLSSTGFSRKRLDDIKTEIEDELKTTFGPYINLLPSSIFSKLVGLFAERESSLWELGDEVYNSQYPDTAEGAQLDNVVALTGITRLASQPSRIIGQLLFGTAATVVPAGTIFSVLGNSSVRFLTDSAVVLVAGADEVQDLDFSLVPTAGTFKLKYIVDETAVLNWNDSAATIQAALNALELLSGVTVSGNFTSGFTITFAGADGKQEHALLEVTSNSLVNGVTAVVTTVVETVAGVPQGTVDMTCETNGETSAPAQTVSVIETPVAGLSSTRNPEDAILGRAEETDLELRQRRENTLQVAGAGTVEAIRSELLSLEGVTDCIVFENVNDLPDIDGRPAKSFEAVVNGGDADEIEDKIWETKPAGIRTYGNQAGTIVDSMGFTHDINWSRPTELDIYLEVDITVTPDAPVNAASLVENALVEYGNTIGIGNDVIVYPRLVCALEQFSWITDVVTRIGLSPSPTLDDNIPVDADEIPSFDTTRTSVTLI